METNSKTLGAGVTERQCAGLEMNLKRGQQTAGGALRHMGSIPIPGAISVTSAYNCDFFLGFRLSSVPQISQDLNL